jgi:hypothetical protein
MAGFTFVDIPANRPDEETNADSQILLNPQRFKDMIRCELGDDIVQGMLEARGPFA